MTMQEKQDTNSVLKFISAQILKGEISAEYENLDFKN
jgi:hypothetical protein